jgi:hypothetical protein
MDAPSSDDAPTSPPEGPLSSTVPPSSPVPASSFAPPSSPVPPSGLAPPSSPVPASSFSPATAYPPSAGFVPQPSFAPGAWGPGAGKASAWRASRTETRRRTFWLMILVIVLVPVVAVLVALAFAGREVGVIASISDDTDGQITRASVNTVGGRVQWELFAAQGLGQADGTRLACDVVRPVFSRHGLRDAEFYVLDRAGDVIGSWRTFCGAPEPVVPAA